MAYKEDIRKKSSYIFWLDVLKLAKDMGIKGGKNRETFLLKLWVCLEQNHVFKDSEYADESAVSMALAIDDHRRTNHENV
jgi:hypothetical protein